MLWIFSINSFQNHKFFVTFLCSPHNLQLFETFDGTFFKIFHFLKNLLARTWKFLLYWKYVGFLFEMFIFIRKKLTSSFLNCPILKKIIKFLNQRFFKTFLCTVIKTYCLLKHLAVQYLIFSFFLKNFSAFFKISMFW